MTGEDLKPLIDLLLQMWERGSILIWALASASLFIGLSLLLLIYLKFIPFPFAWPVGFLIVSGTLVILALFKRHQEKAVLTMVLVPHGAQSFWHHAPQQDGRKLTQISIRGWATNCTDRPLYPSLVRITAPLGLRSEHEFVITQGPGDRPFGMNNPIPPGDRRAISAHFFVKGFIGRNNRSLRLVVSVCDNLGRWHKWVFPSLTNR